MHSQEPRGAWKLELCALLMGAVLALVCVALADEEKVVFDQAALRKDAKLIKDTSPNKTDCGWWSQNSECFATMQARNAQRVALWLGNSQIPTINEYEPGQRTAVPELSARLSRSGLDLMVVDQPNASLQEHLVAYVHTAQHVRLRWVVVSLVFDDTRETGLRPRSAEAMADPAVVARLSRYPVGKRIVERWHTSRQEQAAEDGVVAADASLQTRSEAWLTAWLTRHSGVWRAREQARGKLFLSLHRARNTAFGIKSHSKRPLIAGRYADNLDSLEALLADASSSGIAVLGYVAPLRPDVAIPYVPAEYERFKRDVSALFAKYGATLEDLEALVPARDWGKVVAGSIDGEKTIDFMHFKEPGHRALAAAIAAALERAERAQGAAP